MPSEDEIQANAKMIGEKYVMKLRGISGNLDLEKFKLEYKRISTEAEDELFNYLDSQNVDGHLRSSIGENVFTKTLLPEFRKILEEKGQKF